MKWLTRDHLLPGAEGSADVDPGAGLLKFATVERDASLEASRRVRVVASTSAADRENDVITQAGWQLDNYRNNPVVLFGHDYKSLPVAKAVSLHVLGDRLVMECEFATADENPFAETCYKLVKGGFLNAVSVGFRPTKYKFNDERKGIDFLEQELLELSFVPVPMHPQGLVAARDAGIDTAPLKAWAERVLTDFNQQLFSDAAIDTNSDVDASTACGRRQADTNADTVAACAARFNTTGAAEEKAESPEADPHSITAEMDEMVVDRTARIIATLVKQGRVLSAANESKIRSAVSALSEVLSAMETAPAHEDGATTSQTVQKTDAREHDQLDVEDDPETSTDDTIDENNITLSADDVTELRTMIAAQVKAHMTQLTGRVA